MSNRFKFATVHCPFIAQIITHLPEQVFDLTLHTRIKWEDGPNLSPKKLGTPSNRNSLQHLNAQPPLSHLCQTTNPAELKVILPICAGMILLVLQCTSDVGPCFHGIVRFLHIQCHSKHETDLMIIAARSITTWVRHKAMNVLLGVLCPIN